MHLHASRSRGRARQRARAQRARAMTSACGRMNRRGAVKQHGRSCAGWCVCLAKSSQKDKESDTRSLPPPRPTTTINCIATRKQNKKLVASYLPACDPGPFKRSFASVRAFSSTASCHTESSTRSLPCILLFVWSPCLRLQQQQQQLYRFPFCSTSRLHADTRRRAGQLGTRYTTSPLWDQPSPLFP